MNILVILVPLALLLGVVGLFGFLWSVENGQYDDVDGTARRILSDDDIKLSNDDIES
jgi:cbb3-type cytochrome oxidase maturation protein